MYRGADKSLARPISRCILFDGENISFHASLVIYTDSTNISGPGVAYWLRHCATSRTVPGSIPGGVTGDFFRGSPRRNHVPLIMSTRDFSWGKGGQCVWLKTYHPRSAERQESPGP